MSGNVGAVHRPESGFSRRDKDQSLKTSLENDDAVETSSKNEYLPTYPALPFFAGQEVLSR